MVGPAAGGGGGGSHPLRQGEAEVGSGVASLADWGLDSAGRQQTGHGCPPPPWPEGGCPGA